MLNRSIVDEQRKAFSVSAGYDPFSMGIDLWFAYGMLGPKQQPDVFEQALWQAIRKLEKDGPEAAALAAAKRNMIAEQVFAQDSLYLRAKQIGAMETVGIGADKMDDWLAAIRKVSAADVQQALRRWIRPERSTTGLLKPRNKSGEAS